MTSTPGLFVGIDLGTTFSLVAAVLDGAPVVLPNALGEALTPSAVSVTDRGDVLVGAPARARATTHPEQTALAFKRDMGTGRRCRLGRQLFGPEELSALVLRELKRDAEAALGAPIAEAVVTVPAYFDELQREATRAAAEIAGLPVRRILNEPTAAAIAYGLHQLHREIRAVVLDLGGGTFDVTVLEIIEGVIEIQSSAGDSRLGGEDFTDALAAHAAAGLPQAEPDAWRSHPQAWARLREAAEGAKRHLSDAEEAALVAPELPLPGGGYVDLERRVARAEAEELWAPLLERVRAPISRALADAGLRAEAVDEVLLVGGATRMPCLARLAARIFGRMPLRHLPPDETVALGAAVQAALQKGEASVEEVVVTDVAPFTLGIETTTLLGLEKVSGLFTPVLDRGTVIPASRVKPFSTVDDGQERIRVAVYQGEHSMCRDNRFLGDFEIEGIPRRGAGEEAVDVRFTYDLNGLLEVEATIRSTGRSRAVVFEQTPGRMTPAEIEEARKRMVRLKFHPRDALPNTTALARGEALYLELVGPPREELGNALAVFRAALEGQDDETIARYRERVLALVASLARG